MTLYLVDHGDDDYRLHRYRDESHSELYRFTGFSDWPEQIDIIYGLADAHNGASILGDPDARRDTIELCVGEWVKRASNDVPL
jgi:hypothetical protein